MEKVSCKQCANLMQKGGLRSLGRCTALDNKLVKLGFLLECDKFEQKTKEKQQHYSGHLRDFDDACNDQAEGE